MGKSGNNPSRGPAHQHSIFNQLTMETFTNRFGEKVTKWTSQKHPDNPNFMQMVRWTIWEKPDGRVTIGYNLGANGKTYFLYNLTANEAIEKYS